MEHTDDLEERAEVFELDSGIIRDRHLEIRVRSILAQVPVTTRSFLRRGGSE